MSDNALPSGDFVIQLSVRWSRINFESKYVREEHVLHTIDYRILKIVRETRRHEYRMIYSTSDHVGVRLHTRNLEVAKQRAMERLGFVVKAGEE